MSEENVEIARRLYPENLDLAAMLADPQALETMRAFLEPSVHPDLETVTDPAYQMLLGEPDEDGASRTTFSGIGGFIGAFGDWLVEWERWVVTPLDFIDLEGSRVLVVIDIAARSKAQGIDMTVEGGNLLTFDDARLTRMELFLQRADALEAAGLSE